MKKNVHEIEIKLEGKEWETCLDKAFKKKNKDVKIDGFRKGCAPKEIFLKKMGIESLYMDAVDFGIEIAYKRVMKENNLVPAIEPKLDVKAIDEKSVTFLFTIITEPEVELGEYKNLKIKKETAKASKEEIDKAIEDLRLKYAEIVVKDAGTVEEHDTAVIDFKGTVDGKELEGGSGENYPLEIGSNTFIPGFEEGLIGMTVNEEKDLNLTFPENYTEELSGKKVTFHVTIKEIKQRILPDLNEEFYKDLGYDDITTTEAFKKRIEEDIKKTKEAQIEDEYIEKCLEKAASNMKVDINEEIIDDEVHRMMHQFEDQLKMQGLNLEQYYEFTKTTHDDLHTQMEPEATKRVKYRYLLEAVAEKEKFEITDEEANKEAEKLANNYGISKKELINAYGSLEIVKYDMRMHKAMEIVKGE